MVCDACIDGCAQCNDASAGSPCACAGACARAVTLGAPAPRLGLSAIDTRIGDYARFLADADRRLTSADASALRTLATRDPSDPSIALLDAWSVAADVLTFYRDRLANEGYLRTATQQDALRSLAALTGYRPRPGVAASAQLAYTLDATAAPVTIPAGSKAQTVPQSGEQMQTFETADDLDARAEWSQMTPRRTRVPGITPVDALMRTTLKLADTTLFVRAGERVLFQFGDASLDQVVRQVASAQVDTQNGWVALTLKPVGGVLPGNPAATENVSRLLEIALRFRARILAAHSPEGRRAAAGKPVQDTLGALSGMLLGGSLRDTQTTLEANADDLPESYRAIAGEAIDVLKAMLIPPTPTMQRTIPPTVDAILAQVARPAAPQLPSSRLLRRSLIGELGGKPDDAGDDSNNRRRADQPNGDTSRAALLTQTSSQLNALLYDAWRALPSGATPPRDACAVHLIRTSASPYGASAPPMQHVADGRAVASTEWPVVDADFAYACSDGVIDGLEANSVVIVDSPAQIAGLPRMLRFARVAATQTIGRSDYGMNAKVTRMELTDPASGVPLVVPPASAREQPGPREPNAQGLAYLRDTVYHLQSQRVELAAEPIADDVGGGTLMLDRLYDGLDVGRWLIVAGERTDIAVDDAPLPGVTDGELVLVAGVSQQTDPESPGDSPHTVVTLDRALVHTYRRSGALVYGNVVAATHGETVTEVLGSGDARQSFASFTLARAPLTFVAAPTTRGVASTAQLRVNTILYGEVDSLLDAGPRDRVYELGVDASGAASATFGDGSSGARLPSGQENVRAVYRAGLGSAGNVNAQQISQLSTRPLGVTAVINPLATTGGADPDGNERIRAGTPLYAQTLAPLARLVSVSDYAIFAQQYAGIGHASATLLATGDAQCVYVTVAGVGDNPLDPQDALLTSLAASYAAFGDRSMPVTIGVREVVALFVEAKVAIAADADWNAVEPLIRACVADTFSFDRRQLGQPAFLSEAIAAIQSVAGVAWTDIDIFGGISETDLASSVSFAAAVARLAAQRRANASVDCAPARTSRGKNNGKSGGVTFAPAQIVYLLANVPATLVLNLI